MPKAANATVDDLAEVHQTLEQAIEAVQAAFPSQLQELERKLQFAIDAVTGAVKHNRTENETKFQQIAAEAEAREGEIAKRLGEQIAGVSKDVTELKAWQQGIEQKFEELQSHLYDNMNKEISALCEKIDGEFESIRDLVRSADDKGGQSTLAMLEKTQTLEHQLHAAQEELKKHKDVHDGLSKRVDEVVESQKKVDESQDEAAKSSSSELHIRIDKIREAMKEQGIMSKTNANKNKEELKSQQVALQEQMNERFDEVSKCLTALTGDVDVIANQSARRLEWSVDSASGLLQQGESEGSAAQEQRSCRSPYFTAGGGRGMQLELQVQPPGQTTGGAALRPREAGDASVRLWGRPGMQISCKVYLGDRSEQIEASFPSTSSPTECFACTNKLGFLKDMLAEDGSARIGLELLEASHEVASVKADSKAVSTPQEDVAAVADTSDPVAEKEGEDPEPATRSDAAATETRGLISYARHFQYNMLDEVRRHCELMRSAMVRHVHWRLENASSLKQHFAMGEPMCSIPFSAAGVEGMQFLFYPSGYSGASDGQSSLFLYCPAGTRIKAFLSMGSRRWESTNHFKEAHAFGRVNFARLEKVLDEGDGSVVLGLEIESAQCETQANYAHAPAVRGTAESDSVPAHNTAIKLVKTFNGGTSAVLEGARLLPSIWTPKPLNDLLKLPHGYQSLSVLEPAVRGRGRKDGGAARTRSVSPTQDGSQYPHDVSLSELRASESVPSLMSSKPGGGGGSEPLPKLVGAKNARQGRRPHPVMANPLAMAAATC
mmetsp:Transcript_33339/g.74254  ORF Transcript_33339/g.74254 Transcript_33339/m.74254 type:complete len:777 (-) Transcript_33339:58-2388(-)